MEASQIYGVNSRTVRTMQRPNTHKKFTETWKTEAKVPSVKKSAVCSSQGRIPDCGRAFSNIGTAFRLEKDRRQRKVSIGKTTHVFDEEILLKGKLKDSQNV